MIYYVYRVRKDLTIKKEDNIMTKTYEFKNLTSNDQNSYSKALKELGVEQAPESYVFYDELTENEVEIYEESSEFDGKEVVAIGDTLLIF